MSDAILHWIALALSAAGMAAFALTISAHWRQVFGTRQQSLLLTFVLRTSGAFLLASAFALCAMADPLLMAVLVWPMLLMVGAAIVTGALAVHARGSARMRRSDALR